MSSSLKNSFPINSDWLLLRSIICIVGGVLLWAYPQALAKGIIIGIGTLLIMYALVTSLVSYIKTRQAGNPFALSFVSVVSLLVGVLFVTASSFFAKWFVFAIGILVVLLSIMQLIEIMALRKYSPSLSALSFLSPILLLGVGILVLIKPQQINNLIGYFAAAALVYYGVLGFIFAFNIRKNIKKRDRARAEQRIAKIDVENVEDAEEVN